MKQKFVIQWHITGRCNLRCKHCYMVEYNKDLEEDDLIEIFNQIKAFLIGNNFTGHVNFTGGEPFLTEHLWGLMDLCEENEISFGILTNGTLIDEGIACKLQTYKKLRFIQFSLEGSAKTHDYIRGKGSFQKTAKAIKLVNTYGIQTMVSFTASKNNCKELAKAVRICRRWQVKRFWTDRLVPVGSNELDMMTNEEFFKYLRVLDRESKKSKLLARIGINTTYIHTNRAMQFWCSTSTDSYICSAGKSLLAILEDGTLLPCRRLPWELGNLLEDNLGNIYNKSNMVNVLKSDCTPDECKNCFNVKTCAGGAKCITYALKGDINHKDNNCPYTV
ncbi:MAG: radical SAM protein [Lachnospiraceae bacterium]|nr:radical SAM protein [Lachnospiraceae bacterium]